MNMNEKIDPALHGKTIKFNTKLVDKLMGKNPDVLGKGDVEVSYEDFRRAYPPDKNAIPKVPAMVFWDDVMQFTGLGLLDHILAHQEWYGLDPNNYDIGPAHYMYRTNLYNDSIDFAYAALDKKLRKDQLIRIERNNYWDILQRSPLASMYDIISKAMPAFSSLVFVFKYRFDFIEEIIPEYMNAFSMDKNRRIKYDVYIDDGDREKITHDIIRRHRPLVYFTIDAGTVMNGLLEHNIHNANIITNEHHNGLSEEFLEVLILKFDNSNAPNNTEFNFYEDKIMIDMPQEEIRKLQEP